MAVLEDSNIVEPAAEMLSFNILKAQKHDRAGLRLGRLLLSDRTPIETPHFISITSRGAIPHITQDTMKKHTKTNSVYVALEDFIEKAPRETPPVYSMPAQHDTSALRQFTSLGQNTTMIMGARRIDPIACPAANSNSAVSILTSVGFRQLESEDYAEAARKLQPDIVIGLADIVFGQKPGLKRMQKMGDRTGWWMEHLVAACSEQPEMSEHKQKHNKKPAIFAPVLPMSQGQQHFYLNQLEEELRGHIAGLTLYDPTSVTEIPPGLASLPRMSLDGPKSPSDILYRISLGIDLFAIPFICEATDAGIALDFTFPAPKGVATSEPKQLGTDMWSSEFAGDISPLQDGCTCYTCTRHHKAYIQHLLVAKEMLGWTLLQIHNERVMNEFFAGIRATIAEDTFETERKIFENAYHSELPEKTGQGPRVRGYQFKVNGPNEPKKNQASYTTLDDSRQCIEEAAAAAAIPSPGEDADDLAAKGFAEKAE
ncbi:tRNA-guanine transglycosylase family protein [Xylona heveae TC161]|uniref:Queuine tRNA-ribosyltransferase accessory subunit 2 n=1 Tax=Xylona heveae (strain CBS 132557 / TC161) TaxID=1328760 RepID=A0A165ADU7_XYLHT|nr:tRNA-guanine transglycosylase family protein [Xylona heveae TC161]KZF20314.1 tRNA-guanine transglycosylase family protein [Xylona heveae TC161]